MFDFRKKVFAVGVLHSVFVCLLRFGANWLKSAIRSVRWPIDHCALSSPTSSWLPASTSAAETMTNPRWHAAAAPTTITICRTGTAAATTTTAARATTTASAIGRWQSFRSTSNGLSGIQINNNNNKPKTGDYILYRNKLFNYFR